MRRRDSIRTRTAWSFVLFALVLCSFFSLVAYVAVEVAELQLIDNRLDKLADELIEQHQQSRTAILPPDVHFYVGQQVPPELRHFKPGLHEQTVGEAGEIHVLVREAGGYRYVVTEDTSEFEEAEALIFIAIGVGFVSSLLLALLLGVISARRLVAPVTALAAAIERQDAVLPSLEAPNEIGVLARAFANRTQALEQFLQREKLFTGDVSHELRTPLTIMLGAAELLHRQLDGQPAQQAVAERVRRVASETAERVAALLLLSRAPQALEVRRLSLNHLVARECERFEHLLVDKPVQLTVEGDEADVWVDSSQELVATAIGNLIRNACQHTARGTIRIRMAAGELSVEDDGPGLPHNVRAQLFERYVRGVDNANAGTGLGLAIVKRVVDHLGWTIEHATPAGGGSRFILRFAPVQAG